jgi:hypothetical protein
MSYLNNLKLRTRWENIPQALGDYKLLCANEECSLSCSNLKGGKLSVTSIHGTDRHSQQLSKLDMAFLAIVFLNSLSEKDLAMFLLYFNKVSENFNLNLEKVTYY